jgi:hypothetical protein
MILTKKSKIKDYVDIHSFEEFFTSLSAGCFWLANTTQFL